MRASTAYFSTICLVAITALPVLAQSQLPRPNQLPPAGGQAQQAPANPPQQQTAPTVLAPVKAYKAVAVKLPAPMADASFEPFRRQLGEAARKKDRAALARLVVTQGFFWEAEDGDKADKKKTGIDNLTTAIGLADKDAGGWDLLAGYAADPSATPLPQRQGVVCSPADPSFDDKELEELAKATQTDPGEWGYPLADGIEVRASAQTNSAVVEKLGMHFLRVMPEDGDGAPNAQDQSPMVRVATPSGKTGFVSAEAVAPLGNDQLCYVKETVGWKITGYIGGGDQ
jgi:hypothetical protein